MPVVGIRFLGIVCDTPGETVWALREKLGLGAVAIIALYIVAILIEKATVALDEPRSQPQVQTAERVKEPTAPAPVVPVAATVSGQDEARTTQVSFFETWEEAGQGCRGDYKKFTTALQAAGASALTDPEARRLSDRTLETCRLAARKVSAAPVERAASPALVSRLHDHCASIYTFMGLAAGTVMRASDASSPDETTRVAGQSVDAILAAAAEHERRCDTALSELRAL